MTGMKQIIIFLIAVFFSLACFADTVFVHSTIVIPDSVLVKSLSVGAVKHPFWDSLPSITASIISGLLSIIALSVAYLNTKNTIKAQNENFEKQLKAQEENLSKQLETQLETTVEKEWIEKVRMIVAEIIQYSVIMGSFKQSSTSNSVTKEQYDDAFLKFQTNQILLGLYLDFGHDVEKDIYDLIAQLRGDSEAGLMRQVNTKIREIQLMAQKLFYHKLQK